jgi:hypothetical protein
MHENNYETENLLTLSDTVNQTLRSKNMIVFEKSIIDFKKEILKNCSGQEFFYFVLPCMDILIEEGCRIEDLLSTYERRFSMPLSEKHHMRISNNINSILQNSTNLENSVLFDSLIKNSHEKTSKINSIGKLSIVQEGNLFVIGNEGFESIVPRCGFDKIQKTVLEDGYKVVSKKAKGMTAYGLIDKFGSVIVEPTFQAFELGKLWESFSFKFLKLTAKETQKYFFSLKNLKPQTFISMISGDRELRGVLVDDHKIRLKVYNQLNDLGCPVYYQDYHILSKDLVKSNCKYFRHYFFDKKGYYTSNESKFKYLFDSNCNIILSFEKYPEYTFELIDENWLKVTSVNSSNLNG